MDDLWYNVKEFVEDIWHASLDYWPLTIIIGTAIIGLPFLVIFGAAKLVITSKERRREK